ncbi:MAG: hypothetical protein Q3M30_15285 [Candidatus Electrothrix sp. Rat3]|nr:hypothetical protein [Candidatus Electrothrix rattekaaiensis]
MHTLKIDTAHITLPNEIARKLIGKVIQFIEVRDGIMMKTMPQSVKEARGVLKNKNFSTERHFQLKKEDKAAEK